MKNRIIALLLAGFAFFSCDTELDYKLKIDNRLEGKDEVSITGENGSGVDYTEDFFTGPVELAVISQAQPLRVEVVDLGTSEIISTIESFTEVGENFSSQFSSTVADLGIGIGDSKVLRFKVIFDNAGQDGFDYNAILSVDFTVKDQSPNLALNKPATASVEAWGTVASIAVDGVNDAGYPQIAHTNEADGEVSWFEVDLGAVYNVRQVNVWNRNDCCFDRLTDYHIFVSEDPFVSNVLSEIQAQAGVTDVHSPGTAGFPSKHENINASGRYVRLQLTSTVGERSINLAELQVF
jgi:hypothetical protein